MNEERTPSGAENTMHPPIEQGAALRECLERIEAGASLSAALRCHPEHAEALRPLVQMALALRDLETRPAPPHLADRIELALDAEDMRAAPGPTVPSSADGDALAKRPGWLSRLPAWAGLSAVSLRRTTARPLALRLAAAAAAMLLAVFGSAYASADSLPGDRLYGLKVGIERARLIAVPAYAESTLAERFAKRRLDEALRLEAQGRSAEAALQELERLGPWLGEERAAAMARELRGAQVRSRARDETGPGSKSARSAAGGSNEIGRSGATAVARIEPARVLLTPSRATAAVAPPTEPGPASGPSPGVAGVGATAAADPTGLAQPSAAAPIATPTKPDPGPPPSEPQPSEPEPEEPGPSDPGNPEPGQPDPTATEASSPTPVVPTPSPPPSVDPARMAIVVGQVWGEGSAGSPPVPLVGAIIEFEPQPSAIGAPLPPPSRSMTLEGGLFEARLQPGTYRVYISHPGYLRQEFGERNAGSGTTPGTPITPRAGAAPFQLGRIVLIRDPNQPGPGNALDPIATRPPALGPGHPSPTPEPSRPLPVPSATQLVLEPPAG